MSLNIINETDINTLSETLLKIIKTEEAKQIKDMKTYLNKTNLSEEQKLKQYAEFSANLFNVKISTGLQVAQQYIIRDAELVQSKAQNQANIDLLEAQKALAAQNELSEKEKTKLIIKQTAQVEEETKATKTKTWLAIAETKTKIDNTVASTLTEARKNGADVTSVKRTWTDPTTGTVVDYQHLSLAAASATDQAKGLVGMQMLQLQKQADTFKDHTQVQIANQIMQLGSTAVSEGMTEITGILQAHKNLSSVLVGDGIFSTNYTSIG